MTENNNQTDQPTDEQHPSDEAQQKLREISEEELKQILEDHKKWLETDEKQGQVAELPCADLEKADLSNVNLKYADFNNANLPEANFYEANLREIIFYKANLEKAKLFKTNMQYADLINANLKEAVISEANIENADLSKANIENADLSKANIENANLSGANLENANLSGANLQGAVLNNANMKNTVLDGVKGLAEANLQYANLEGATGLLGNEFAQADLTGTKLPKNIEEFKALETVKETSQNARKIFFAMLLGCVYSWLTIATTTDVRLLTNTASSPLPIIGTEIPIAWFYIAAPLVLICLYFYFHLYLDNLWEGLASLPAIFPDGKRLDQRAYPWLLNTLVRKHFKRLKSRPLIARMKEWITIFLGWFVVPITMIAFWLRYIPRHDWVGTILHIGLIVLSFAFAIIFYRLCATTLQGKKKSVFQFPNFWMDRRFYYGISVVFICILLSFLSYGAINGVRPSNPKDENKVNFYRVEEIIPWAFEKIGYDVFANFKDKDVSEKPDNYWEIDEQERLKSVKGASLKNRNLKNADMERAFLVRADFHHAVLYGANLFSANLELANLMEANLQQTKLWMVNLQDAFLYGAKLQEADLFNANLQGAILMAANLELANLSEANLQQTDLWMANLTGAKNLSVEQLSNVKTLYKAKLSPDLLEQVKKCCPHLLEEPKERIVQYQK